MKKIEDTKILSSAQKFEQMHFFINCSKTKCGTCTAYFCLSSCWHFLCRADDIFEKSVEQSRFEQMHFEHLTLTQRWDIKWSQVIYISETYISCLSLCKTFLNTISTESKTAWILLQRFSTWRYASRSRGYKKCQVFLMWGYANTRRLRNAALLDQGGLTWFMKTNHHQLITNGN